MARDSEMFAGIEIQGETAFRSRSREALALLQSAKSFEFVQTYIAILQQARRSGMKAWLGRPTFTVGRPTWQHSALWYAGAIAHDAYHSKLYHDAKSALGDLAPDPGAWTGVAAERQCLKFQREILTRLSADSVMLAYIVDLAKAPSYQGRGSWLDYRRRWW